MSTLLPQQIPAPSTPIIDGTGRVNKTWWLFLYNLSQQVLGNQIDPSGIQLLLSDDVDSFTAASNPPDAILDTDLPVVFPPSSDLLVPDVAPANQAQPESAVSVGTSPFTYAAPFDGWLLVTGGTVSALEVSRSGSFYTTGGASGFIPVARLDQVRITHTGAPTVTFFPS